VGAKGGPVIKKQIRPPQNKVVSKKLQEKEKNVGACAEVGTRVWEKITRWLIVKGRKPPAK